MKEESTQVSEYVLKVIYPKYFKIYIYALLHKMSLVCFSYCPDEKCYFFLFPISLSTIFLKKKISKITT